MKFSVIVPVLNEEKSVAQLHKEILEVMQKLSKSFEIIFIDDGSTDKTFPILRKLKPVKIIKFRKNFGQSAALDAGVKNSQGEILITLDGDGQNNPRDVPKLLKKLKKGCDVVCGWRKHRQDPALKKFVSAGAAFLRKFLASDSIHDSGCSLRVYKKECFDNLDLCGEMHRMLPALLKWRGFKIAEVEVGHRARKFGKTKYNYKRIIKGFLDMVYIWFWRKYESRPLHLFGTLGLALSSLSFLLGLYLGIKRAFFNYSLSDKIWPLVATTGFIAGVQLVIFGLLADLIIKNRQGKAFYKIEKFIKN